MKGGGARAALPFITKQELDSGPKQKSLCWSVLQLGHQISPTPSLRPKDSQVRWNIPFLAGNDGTVNTSYIYCFRLIFQVNKCLLYPVKP